MPDNANGFAHFIEAAAGVRNSSVLADLLRRLGRNLHRQKAVHALKSAPVIATIKGKHAVGCDRATKADQLEPFPAGWESCKDMVDGPGSIRFDAAAILFIDWCADR